MKRNAPDALPSSSFNFEAGKVLRAARLSERAPEQLQLVPPARPRPPSWIPKAARVGILRPTARLLDALAHLTAGAQLLVYPSRLGPCTAPSAAETQTRTRGYSRKNSAHTCMVESQVSSARLNSVMLVAFLSWIKGYDPAISHCPF
jgi:hypothetical protein